MSTELDGSVLRVSVASRGGASGGDAAVSAPSFDSIGGSGGLGRGRGRGRGAVNYDLDNDDGDDGIIGLSGRGRGRGRGSSANAVPLAGPGVPFDGTYPAVPVPVAVDAGAPGAVAMAPGAVVPVYYPGGAVAVDDAGFPVPVPSLDPAAAAAYYGAQAGMPAPGFGVVPGAQFADGNVAYLVFAVCRFARI